MSSRGCPSLQQPLLTSHLSVELHRVQPAVSASAVKLGAGMSVAFPTSADVEGAGVRPAVSASAVKLGAGVSVAVPNSADVEGPGVGLAAPDSACTSFTSVPAEVLSAAFMRVSWPHARSGSFW